MPLVVRLKVFVHMIKFWNAVIILISSAISTHSLIKHSPQLFKIESRAFAMLETLC